MSTFLTARSYAVIIDTYGHFYIQKTTVGDALRLIDEGKAVAHFLDATEAGRYADHCNGSDPDRDY